MKNVIISLICFLWTLSISAQKNATDSVFNAYIYNAEYQVYMEINLYANDISVPGQEIFGKTPGYIGAVRDSRKWLITEAKISNVHSATLEIVNDYGSEDFSATLTYDNKDNSYILRQTGGSRLKIVVNRKWVKIPIELKFVPHDRVMSRW